MKEARFHSLGTHCLVGKMDAHVNHNYSFDNIVESVQMEKFMIRYKSLWGKTIF